MLKCPFCNFQNEDGALFCEQCKSDLASAAAPAAANAPIPLVPLPDSVPMAAVIEEPIPMASIEPIAAAPMAAVIAEPAPVAAPIVAAPVAAVVAEPAPPPPAAAPRPPAAPAPPPHRPRPPKAPSCPPTPNPAGRAARTKNQQEFPIYEGMNFIGRADEKPVDIDLEDQEPPDRIWCSRQHALIGLEDGMLTIEDLNQRQRHLRQPGPYLPRSKEAIDRQ